MKKDILWEPECGTCGTCGGRGRIRQYASDGEVVKLCFTCWDSNQEPRVMSSLDWDDEDRVVFTYPSSEPPSRAA